MSAGVRRRDDAPVRPGGGDGREDAGGAARGHGGLIGVTAGEVIVAGGDAEGDGTDGGSGSEAMGDAQDAGEWACEWACERSWIT